VETALTGIDDAVPSADLARILKEHGAALARAAASYARSDAERKDLLQEIALALFRALSSFRGDCSERAFILRVAHNQGITFSTRRKPPAEDLSDETPSSSPDPERALEGKQRVDRLHRAIHSLPLGHRQVVAMLLEDLSHEEIAAVLGISVSNVAVRLHRARTALRDLLAASASDRLNGNL